MNPLTGAGWSGLPLYTCEDADGTHAIDIEIPVPLLVLWSVDGATIDVRQTITRRWAFMPRANHFGLFTAGAYDAVVSPPSSSSALVIALPWDWCRAAMPAARTVPSMPPRFGYQDRHLLRLVRGLDAHRRGREPLGSLYTESLSIGIVNHLYTANADGEGRSSAVERALPAAIERAVERLIDDRLDTPPKLSQMAALAGMGTAHFLRAFKISFGLTPYQYVLQRRIDRAKRLLASEDRSLTSMALELGFASHAHFTSAFHARTGMTPSAFRRGKMAPGR